MVDNTSEVFISYSHQDEDWKNRLKMHLKPYLRKDLFRIWDDSEIPPGGIWFEEIIAAIGRARVVIFLVSADLLASDFIAEHEIGPFLAKAARGGSRIIWVPIKYSAYEETAFKDYEAAWNPENPLESLDEPEQNSALIKIAKTIKDAAINP